MGIIVKKFGGTSVGDIARIKKAAALVAGFRQAHPDDRLVIVVSAMAGETNRLLALARSCVRDPAPRELDSIAATGEQVSASLMTMALQELNVASESFAGHQLGIVTDDHFTAANIQRIDCERLKRALDRNTVPVVTGFQGLTEQGDITTLGRGGSDITAVAIAAALEASACYIYTDVEGVFSTDPRICPEARLVERISHEEMLEMASLGAKVLHPRSVYFAMRYKVPLVVLSTFKPGPGTWIIDREKFVENPLVTGITYRADEALLSINELQGGIQSLRRIFSELSERGIEIDVISQTVVEEKLCDVSFTVPDEVSSQAFEIVQGLIPELGAKGASIDRNISKVSVVGIGIRNQSSVVATMFDTLARENIDPHMISTSDIKVSVVIPRKYYELAVRSLHEAFIEMEPQRQQEG